MYDPDNKSRSPRLKGIYLFPNLVTTGVLFAGFYGIVAAIDDNYVRSAVALLIAMILDGLDGRLARLTGTESDFGKEFDSLSDLVAFGVAPAIIVYQWGLVRLAEYGWVWGKIGWLAAFIYAAAAAMRLARFNVLPDDNDKRYFEGLPSPSAAALVTFMVWLFADHGWNGGFVMAVACIITPVAGLLMVSRFKFYSFKEVKSDTRISYAYLIVIPLTIVLVSLSPAKVLFSMAAGYAISGPVLTIYLRRKQPEALDDDRADHQGSPKT